MEIRCCFDQKYFSEVEMSTRDACDLFIFIVVFVVVMMINVVSEINRMNDVVMKHLQ